MLAAAQPSHPYFVLHHQQQHSSRSKVSPDVRSWRRGKREHLNARSGWLCNTIPPQPDPDGGRLVGPPSNLWICRPHAFPTNNIPARSAGMSSHGCDRPVQPVTAGQTPSNPSHGLPPADIAQIRHGCVSERHPVSSPGAAFPNHRNRQSGKQFEHPLPQLLQFECGPGADGIDVFSSIHGCLRGSHQHQPHHQRR